MFLQNAEKLQRKAESRKTAATVVAEEAAKKKKPQKPRTKPTPLLVGSTLSPRVVDVDSENTESASETESNSEDSGSESTITDSGEETEISTVSVPPPQGGKGVSRSVKRANRASTSSYRTEEAVGLFISAAEALDNMVPVEIALHDHDYALPPDALINNVDLQGSSGLSLIAAAAAVVSPSFPRTSGKSSPVLSPVRAPRGRPPNTQRRSGSNSTSKLLPNFLSPAGSSSSVLLTDLKSPTFRNRTRSAPTDRPKSTTMLHIPRPGSSLTKSSFSSSGGSGSGSGNNGSSSGSRFGPSGRATSGGSSSSSVLHSYSRQRSDTTFNKPVISIKPSQAGTSAFEALVNAAAAAPPAELPRSSGSLPTSRYSSSTSSSSSHSHSHSHSRSSSHSYPSNKGSSSSSKSGATLSTLINAHHHHHSSSSTSSSSISSHKDSSTVSSTSGKTTAYIDVGQAITILASLAQQASSNTSTPSTISVQPFIAGHPSTSLIGSLVSQVNSRQGGSGNSSNKSAPTVETLIGHLTSGMANGAKLDSSKKSTSAGGGGSSKKAFPSKSEPSSNSVAATLSISQGPPANNSNSNSSNSSTGSASNGNRDHKSLPTHSTTTTTPHTIQITASVDDLSNLNLLSSLVAAVAASQTANPNTSGANSGTSVHVQHQPQLPPTTSIVYTLTNATTTGTPVTSRPNSLQAEHHRRASPVSVQRRGSMDVASSPSASSPAIPSRPHISSDLSSGGFPSTAHYSLENDTTTSRSRESERSSQDRDGYGVQMGNGNDRGAPQERDSNNHTHQTMGYSSYNSEDSGDNLPRSVVRTSLAARVREGSDCDSTNSSEPQDAYSANSPLNLPPSSTKTSSSSLQSQAAAPSSSSDMTASLASIIPPFNPSNNQQSSLLLYTHSLSFPLSAASEMATDEEDHLESATRGISELSKLLGTDSGGDTTSSLNWNPADLLSPPQSSSKMFSSKGAGGGEYGNSTVGDEMAATTKPVFSGLLESQIHGTIHHSPGLVNSAVGKAAASSSTATPAGVTTNEELEHHSR